MSLRLFAALPIPDDVAARLMPLMRGVAGAKWRPRENLHVTLRFFDTVNEPTADDLDAALEEAGRSCAPFEIALKGAGVFGGADPHAIWIGVAENPALKALAAACERAARRAGLKPESRKYVPHVTMAYLSGTPSAQAEGFAVRCSLFESAAWRVERFDLYSSWQRKRDVSQYRLEADYPLLG